MDSESFEFPPELFGQVPLFAELSKAMSWAGGPVNWDIARQIATAMARGEHAAPVIDADRAELADAGRLTQAWLEEVASVAEQPPPPQVLTLSPDQSADRALRLFPELIDPLAGKLSKVIGDQQKETEAPLARAIAQMVPLFLGIQAGMVIGQVTRSTLTGYDLALPLEEDGTISIVVPHVDAHAVAYGVDRRQMRYWATLRAVSRRMVYEALPWTRTHFYSLYHQYLAAVDVDLSDALERLQRLEIADPQQLQDALGGGLFGLGEAPVIGPALSRLHRFLALLEASADRAATAAAAGRLVEASRIAESIARRRAETPGERLLERFVGLEIPADVTRAADAFCDRLLASGGWPLLSSLWIDPERLPDEKDLADPDGWIARSA